MKFEVERIFLVRTCEEIDLDPKHFLHCANIEELNCDVDDYINSLTEHPIHPGIQDSEQVGLRYSDI